MCVVGHECAGFRSELYGFLCREGNAHQFSVFVEVSFTLFNRPLPWISIFFPFVHLELLGKIFNSIIHLEWTGEEILLL